MREEKNSNIQNFMFTRIYLVKQCYVIHARLWKEVKDPPKQYLLKTIHRHELLGNEVALIVLTFSLKELNGNRIT